VFDGELAAGTPNHILGRAGLDELKTVAEGTPLANKCVDINIAGRQREFEADNLSDGNFHEEHRGNARLANVNRMSAHHR